MIKLHSLSNTATPDQKTESRKFAQSENYAACPGYWGKLSTFFVIVFYEMLEALVAALAKSLHEFDN